MSVAFHCCVVVVLSLATSVNFPLENRIKQTTSFRKWQERFPPRYNRCNTHYLGYFTADSERENKFQCHDYKPHFHPAWCQIEYHSESEDFSEPIYI